jgi:hypothetical protein
MRAEHFWHRPWFWLIVAMLVTTTAYLPGASGAYMFDDFPNIVDNNGVHVSSWSIPSLVSAALSSPSSEFKRPLASLSFAMNYLVSGLDPFGMKVTNIVIHVINGLVAFALLRLLLAGPTRRPTPRDGFHAVIVASLWMLLPINLTAVLYVVQRMESLANLFVLLGLLGYTEGRRSMMAGGRGFALAATSLIVATGIGLLAKETAVLTPLYAALIEWFVFGFKDAPTEARQTVSRRACSLFIVILALPFIVGAVVVGPSLFSDATWAPRSFTMPQRLLSECRIVVDYIAWTLLPMPSDLSFYHDDFVVSTGWFQPWTTALCAAVLAALAGTAFALRRTLPLFALGIAWFFACHVLTATIIPLELIYEHRNYFASLGLMLALVSLVHAAAAPGAAVKPTRLSANVLLAILGVYSLAMTAYTATHWEHPLTLSRELAIRAPQSPRAQYELGRAYVIASEYKPESPFVAPAYAALERASVLPRSSTLAEQALIFFAAKMKQPIKDEWWTSMEAKLRANTIAIEDESAIMSLSSCLLQKGCDLPDDKMLAVYLAALSHPSPRSRLLAAYSEFAWAELGDRALGYAMIRRATSAEPSEPAYHITTLRYALAVGDVAVAREQLASLERLNVGSRLDSDIGPLRGQIDAAAAAASSVRSR